MLGNTHPKVLVPGNIARSSVRDASRWASGLLAGVSDTPRLEADLLLAAVLEVAREELYAYGERGLCRREADQYARLVQRRLAHEPLAYLLGRKAFYDVELIVDPRVLVPRPETELLVEAALGWAQGQGSRSLRLVDVGTGSGALAIVLARHLPLGRIVAIDSSMEALQVAAANVDAYGLRGQVALLQGDLLAPVTGPLDLIVSNPPYVPRDRLAKLPKDVGLFEPRLALDGGADGLALVRSLLVQAAERLQTPGLMLVEVDATQGDAVRDMAVSCWPHGHVCIASDYAGRDRMLRVELV